MRAQEALNALFLGNKRFVEARMEHPRLDIPRRRELLSGQKPFAAILCCSDSRVPPEHLFDQGLGDLFVVRLAGNVVDILAAASLEYAAAHLHVPLIIVLGHSSCGAIKAAMTDTGAAPGHLPNLIDAIKPAITTSAPGEGADVIARASAKRTATLLTHNPVLSELVMAGALRIVSAFYEMSSGMVTILE
jgi:carbonic anhydrase